MITPSRLQLARQRRQLTGAALARQVGLGVRFVADFEQGRREPSAAEVAALARALDFPVDFFDAPEPADLTEDAVSFRARTKLPARRRAAALAAGQLAIEFNSYVEELCLLPWTDVPPLRTIRPSAAAEIVRESWALGKKPVPNLVHLLELHGVRVFSLGVDHTEVDAFSFWYDGTPFVFLNNSKSAEQGRFDAAHELGHLVLHGAAHSLAGVDAEAEANEFAAAFLMPELDVLTYVPDDPSLDQVLRAHRRWQVSALSLTHRLRDLRQLSDEAYLSLCVELTKRARRTDDKNPLVRESSQQLAKVFRSLRERGATPHELAGQLRLSMNELNSMVFGLVVTVLPGATTPVPRSGTARSSHLRLV